VIPDDALRALSRSSDRGCTLSQVELALYNTVSLAATILAMGQAKISQRRSFMNKNKKKRAFEIETSSANEGE
jgi:hypothetical protein